MPSSVRMVPNKLPVSGCAGVHDLKAPLRPCTTMALNGPPANRIEEESSLPEKSLSDDFFNAPTQRTKIIRHRFRNQKDSPTGYVSTS